MHLSAEEDTAKPVVSVAIFAKDTNFITPLLETDDDNAINLNLNADTVFPDWIYLKRWKDHDKADARHVKVKEELDNIACFSIEFSGKLCSDTADERCTAEKRNDLLADDNGASDVVPRCTCAIDTKTGDQGPYDVKQVPSSGNCLSGKLSDLTSTMPRTSTDMSRLVERLN